MLNGFLAADMFLRTAHVEMIVLLGKNREKPKE